MGAKANANEAQRAAASSSACGQLALTWHTLNADKYCSVHRQGMQPWAHTLSWETNIYAVNPQHAAMYSSKLDVRQLKTTFLITGPQRREFERLVICAKILQYNYSHVHFFESHFSWV